MLNCRLATDKVQEIAINPQRGIEEFATMRAGTYQADGPRVVDLRSKLGWNQQELAEKAGCSKSTVARIEDGKPTILRNIQYVATALQVEIGALLMHESAASQVENGIEHDLDENELAIELVINRNFDEFSEPEQKRLLAAIKELIGIHGDIRVLRKRRGSVKLTIKLTEKQADDVLWAAKSGSLEALGIVDALLPERSAILRAHEMFRRSPLPELRRIQVTGNESEVTLTGVVSSYYLKQLAQETVRSLLKGRTLRNRIAVKA